MNLLPFCFIFLYLGGMISQGIISSPVGPLQLESSSTGLRALRILPVPKAGAVPYGYDKALHDTVRQLDEYFHHGLKEFRISFDLEEHPDFYKNVWRVLRTIPYGKTRTYTEIAQFLQNPKWARAVGNASAHNPVAIIIPCHRVIGKNGALTGYAYGTAVKRKLLKLENPENFADQGSLFDPDEKDDNSF